MTGIRHWLEELGLVQYADAFEANDIDSSLLPRLNDQALKDVGVTSTGHRLRLLRAIEGFAVDEPVPIAQSIQGSPLTRESNSAAAERRQLTVMFCDLVGSTALAERLDPEELRDLMQAYQRACRGVVEKYGGHVAQYLGDGLMIYFGWPQAHEDDAVRAIRAGLEVTEAVSNLTSSTPLRARVGIHTGLVVVGETGQGDASIPKAAVGETPNIAARLQALAEPGSVVLSEHTRSLAGGLFDYTDLGAQALKGVSEPMHLFKVVGARASDSRFDAAHGEVALTPLVGREEEVELLLRRWAQAKTGEGQVVLLCGEPGIGKSRITQVLRERIAAESHTRLRYQCSPFHTHSALHPVIEQFERAAGFAREDTPEEKLDKMEALLGEGVAEVKSVGPLFAALLSLPVDRYPPLNLSPQKQKEKTLEALSVHVEGLAAKRPVLMLLEDAHWVDPTTQELFELTISRLTQHRILLVITYRPEYSAPWVGQPNVTSLTLNRLNRRKGTDLVAKLTRGRTLPPEVLDQILTHTDGVPLFVEELTKSVLESRLLRDLGDHYVLDAALPALAIPTTLRDSLLARLDRLAPIREIAQIGACIGREFSYELLAALSPLKGVPLDEALEQLTKTGLVSRRGTPPDAIYIFKHALVQDAAYDSLLKSKRAQLHAQIAQVLEKDFADQVANEPELLAHHFTQARLIKQAIRYWHLAGERAGERLAYAEAIAYFQRGIELVGALPEAPDVAALELGLQIKLGFALIPAKGYTAPEALRAFTRAEALCQQAGETELLFGALRGLFAFSLVRGEVRSAHEFAERCVVLAERAGSSEMLTGAHMCRGSSAHRLGHFASARVDLEKGVALYNVAVHGRMGFTSTYALDPKVSGLAWLAATLWALGYPDQALACCAEVAAAAQQISHPFSQCFAPNAATHVHDLRREPEAIEMYADALIAVATEQGFPFWTMIGTAFRCHSLIEQGKGGSEELAQLRGAIDSLRATGALEPALHHHLSLAQAYLHLGDIHAALESCREGLRLTQQQAEGWLEVRFLRLLGDVLLARSDRADVEAERFYLESIELARRQEAKSFELQAALALARLWSHQGKRKQALELLQPVYDWFTEGRSTPDHLEAAALLAELR